MKPQPQPMPHSEESERATLACVLLKPDLAPQLFDELPADAYYLERHQCIYRAFQAVATEDQPIDLRTLQSALQNAGVFEAIGGFAYLSGLDLDLPDIDRFEFYCRIVRERYAKRRLIEFGTGVARAAFSGQPPDEIVAGAEQALADIERGQLEAAPVTRLGDIALDLDFQRNEPGMIGITSGIADLDKVTAGWRPGHLVTLAGATSMGKTSGALGFAVEAAKSGRSVLVVSLEMTENELLNRCLSLLSRVPHESIDLGRVPKARLDDTLGAVRVSQDLELWLCDRTPQTPQSIAATARRQRVRHGLDLLVVDYLGLVKYTGPHREKRLQIGDMAWSFKMLAKGLGIPVMELQQLKRLDRPRRPTLSDLKESGDIENHSDVVILFYREGYYEVDAPQGTAEMIVAKNRGGRTGSVQTAWDGPTMTFRDLERRQDEPRGRYGWE